MACKSNKIAKYINYTIEVTTNEGRTFIGKFLAFDKYMNMIISECKEVRTIVNKKTKQEKQIERTLGLILLRGDNIQGYSIVSPPPKKEMNMNEMPAKIISSGPQTNPSLAVPPRGMGINQPMIPGMYPPMGMVPGMYPPMGMVPPQPMMNQNNLYQNDNQ